MKKSLFALALAVSATASFAQTMISASQVCQRVASINGSNGSICAQLISRNNFDPAVLSLAHKATTKSTAVAVQILQVSANGRMDPAAGQVCENVLNVNPQNAIKCAEAVLNTAPAPEILRIANRLISKASINAVEALQAGANAYIYPPLAEVCDAMAGVNGPNTVICVQTIANKISMNGAEMTCRASIQQGSSYALQCLQGIVMDYVPAPQDNNIMVSSNTLNELRRDLMKARAQLQRGLINQAQRTLEESTYTVDLILNGER